MDMTPIRVNKSKSNSVTVFKYILSFDADTFDLTLPKDAVPLCVKIQYERPCLWALVDKSQEVVSRKFRWAGTGHPIDCTQFENGLVFIDTVMFAGDSLVFHLFEIV